MLALTGVTRTHTGSMACASTFAITICTTLPLGKPHPCTVTLANPWAEPRTPTARSLLLRREVTCSACTRQSLRQEGALNLHVTLDGLLQILEPLGVDAQQRKVPAGITLHPATRAAFQDLSYDKGINDATSVSLFTDGSFNPDTGAAGWAVTIIGHNVTGDHWLGFASGPVGTGCRADSLSKEATSAFQAEMDAMAFALGIAASCDGRQINVVFDCQSAAGIAMCQHVAHSLPSYARNFGAIRAIAQERRNVLVFHHVAAHKGHPYNECSDALAKAAASGMGSSGLQASLFVQAFREGILPHFWWTVTDAVAHGSLPGLDDNGVTIPCQACQPFLGSRDWLPGVPSVVADSAGDVEPAAQWRLKAATYNVTALLTYAPGPRPHA